MNLLSVKQSRLLFKIIVISLSISPAFATSLEDQRNYLLIGLMVLGLLLLPFSKCILPKIEHKLVLILLLSFIFQLIFCRSHFRLSSLLYTCLFMGYFVLGIRCFFKSQITSIELERLLAGLIIAYFMVLIIQQLCVILGLPVFNTVIRSSVKWKLNSLAAEPSHTSRYVGILMYSYLTIKDDIAGGRMGLINSIKRNSAIWIAFLWIMLTTFSGTGILIVFLICSRFINKNNLLIMIPIIVLLFSIGISSDFVALRRSTSFVSAVTSGDYTNMLRADHSASVRVVPMLLCFNRINPFSLKGWVGSGSGSTSEWLSKYMPGLPEGATGGGIMNYALEYGIIVALVYLIVSFKCCYNKENRLTSIGLWIMCVALEGINMQMAWFCILLLFIVKQNFRQRDPNKNSPQTLAFNS